MEFLAEHPFSLWRGALSECDNIRQMQRILEFLMIEANFTCVGFFPAVEWVLGHFY